MYKNLIRPILFLFSAEKAHHITFFVIKLWKFLPGLLTLLNKLNSPPASAAVTLAGINFPSRVGLAAGFDKDAVLVNEMSALGFGFIEIGTLTPRPQDGNPKPRLFRLKEDNAIINRMGFNNSGVYEAIGRLKKRNPEIIVGGNIGKNKATPNECAADDYIECFRALYPWVNYFVVNISSPNTPGLRELQDKEPLTSLLNAVMAENSGQEKPRPVFLKIAPDISDGQAAEIVEIALKCNLSGLIISNTTLSRSGLKTDKGVIDHIGPGGLSGKPLRNRSTELLKFVAKAGGKRLVYIASGGIFSASDAVEKYEAGADLVQIYTGLIYEGPSLIRDINRIKS